MCLGTAAGAQAAQTVTLDTHVEGAPGSAGPVATTAPLIAGARYYVIVTGTMSIWGAARWSAPGTQCGASEELPMFESPGSVNGPVGWDAETVFAVPPGVNFYNFTCVPSQIPFQSTKHSPGGFQISVVGAGGFAHVTPVGGELRTPTANHTYTYAVIGSGQSASFRFVDEPVTDDYGLFAIRVLTAEECAATNCEGTAKAVSEAASSAGGAETTSDLTAKGEVKSSKTIKLPSVCHSVRHFPIHFQIPRGVKVAKVAEFINGHLVRSFSPSVIAHIVKAGVNLRGLPAGSFTLELRVTTTRGQVLRTIRPYHTCKPGKKHAKTKK
jgi:hypothetical protein